MATLTNSECVPSRRVNKRLWGGYFGRLLQYWMTVCCLRPVSCAWSFTDGFIVAVINRMIWLHQNSSRLIYVSAWCRRMYYFTVGLQVTKALKCINLVFRGIYTILIWNLRFKDTIFKETWLLMNWLWTIFRILLRTYIFWFVEELFDLSW